MERNPICPNCLSRFENIHGLVYRVGVVVGERCEDVWHRGAQYDPNKWDLSEADKEFLLQDHISIR